jgi:hypothetical protein
VSQQERFGVRDLSYSAWHRVGSIQRFVGWEAAQLLSMVDADCLLFLEYAAGDKAPVALAEVGCDVGQDFKPATAILQLARRAKIPAYLLLYERAAAANPADPRWPDLAGFRVKRLWPRTERGWRRLTPGEWAVALLQIRAWSARRLNVEAANDPHWEPRQEQQRLVE